MFKIIEDRNLTDIIFNNKRAHIYGRISRIYDEQFL